MVNFIGVFLYSIKLDNGLFIYLVFLKLEIYYRIFVYVYINTSFYWNVKSFIIS